MKTIEDDLVALGNRRLPSVVDRAIRADQDWEGLLGFDDKLLNLTTWYSQVFRPQASRSTLPDPDCSLLNRGYETASLESPGTAAATVGVVCALCLVATLVCTQIVGRPSLAEAEKALDLAMAELALVPETP